MLLIRLYKPLTLTFAPYLSIKFKSVVYLVASKRLVVGWIGGPFGLYTPQMVSPFSTCVLG